MRLLALLILLLAGLAGLLAPATAGAATGRCFGGSAGPTCHVWTGKVVRVIDGDTMDVRIRGAGVERVRMAGVQAMELERYARKRRAGECHAVEATVRLERLIRRAGWRVRLVSVAPRDFQGMGRLRRVVQVRQGGRWRDTGRTLIREGHALWFPGLVQTPWNRPYNEAMQRAAQERRNLWDPSRCGSGPAQEARLRVYAASDPLGNDEADLNGEWIKVHNVGPTAVPLARWWVRDAQLRRFTFPAGTVVAPGATVTLHAGHGTDGTTAFYWRQPKTVFENANGDGRDLGDGAYLFDPQGDLRAAMVYPCLVACSDPNQGAIELTVHPRRPEHMRLRNVSGRTVDLFGYGLALPRGTYPFGERSLLGPGQTMRVDVGGDPARDTPLHRHWGSRGFMLEDSGGSLRLLTHSRITIACAAWGSGRC